MSDNITTFLYVPHSSSTVMMYIVYPIVGSSFTLFRFDVEYGVLVVLSVNPMTCRVLDH
jgi:hypothetical protein